jgi:hypothetical protein
MRKTDKARSIGETVQRDAEKKEADVSRMKKELADVQQAFQRAQGKGIFAIPSRGCTHHFMKRHTVELWNKGRL